MRKKPGTVQHFAGSQVARVGKVVETMNHLGHSTVAASLRYQHLVSGRDVEIAHQLSALATTPAKVAALVFVADDLDGEPASSKTA